MTAMTVGGAEGSARRRRPFGRRTTTLGRAHRQTPTTFQPEPATWAGSVRAASRTEPHLPDCNDHRGHRWRSIVAVLTLCDLAAVAAITRSWQATLAVAALGLVTSTYSRRYHLGLLDSRVHWIVLPVIATLVTALSQPTSLIGGAVLFAAVTCGIVCAQAIGVGVSRRIRRRRPRPAVIIGNGLLGRTLATTVAEHPDYGLAVVGYVTDTPDDDIDVPQIGYRRAFREIQQAGITDVLCAYGPESDAETVLLLRRLQRLRIRLAVVPRMFDMSPVEDHIWGIPVLPLRTALAFDPVRRALKRGLELAVVGTALIVLSPVMALCALAVRLSSRGPVLYRQKRLTEDGREFAILKFRTMRIGADNATGWTVKGDPRRTTVGRLLRRSGIDELPQLFNILRGDMSLIGPRPERLIYHQRFAHDIPGYEDRTRVPAGLTGLAQVHGLRGDTSIAERARFDNRYIDRHSLVTDLAVLLSTIVHLFKDEGSY